MRKHIIGFALFAFIVTCGAVIYGFLYTPPMPEIAEVTIPVTHAPVEVRKETSALSYELTGFTVDLEKRRATIDVTIDWDSAEKPPAGLVLDFGLTTADRPFAGISLGYQNLSQPFAYGRTLRRTFILDLKEFNGLGAREEAYYGYMGATDIAEVKSSSTRLVYTEKNRMIGAIPALVRYPLKK